MPQYMDVHEGFRNITQDDLMKAHQKDLAVEKAEGVHFIKAWADPKSGKAFCLSEAPNSDAVRRVHQKAGHPPVEVYEVPISVE